MRKGEIIILDPNIAPTSCCFASCSLVPTPASRPYDIISPESSSRVRCAVHIRAAHVSTRASPQAAHVSTRASPSAAHVSTRASRSLCRQRTQQAGAGDGGTADRWCGRRWCTKELGGLAVYAPALHSAHAEVLHRSNYSLRRHCPRC